MLINKSEKGNTKDKFVINGNLINKILVDSPKKEKLVKSLNESKNTTGIKSNFRIENEKNKKNDLEDKIIIPGGSSFE